MRGEIRYARNAVGGYVSLGDSLPVTQPPPDVGPWTPLAAQASPAGATGCCSLMSAADSPLTSPDSTFALLADVDRTIASNTTIRRQQSQRRGAAAVVVYVVDRLSARRPARAQDCARGANIWAGDLHHHGCHDLAPTASPGSRSS